MKTVGLKNQKGFATVESVALLVVFLLLLTYGMGFFGAIHSAVLNSISARAYAWETFAHRTNVSYFRAAPIVMTHNDAGYRSHTVISELNPSNNTEIFFATERGIAWGRPTEGLGRDGATHAGLQRLALGRAERQRVNPIWIRTVYGLCLDSNCGGVTGEPQ